MKDILSSRSKRQLELMELLADNEWVTFSTASELLDVPIKTLKSDIVELGALLAPTTIESSKKYGIRLVTNFSFCKTTIYQKFIKNSVEFQLIEQIFLYDYGTVIDLANSLYISVSTIKRIVLRVNQLLQVEGFSINLKKMQLIGDPHSICNFMQHYFYEKYGIAESLLTSAQLAILDQVSLHIVKQSLPEKNTYNLDFSLMNRLRFYTFTIINLLKHNSENELLNIPEKEFTILRDTYLCDEFYSQFHLPLSADNLNIFFYLFFNNQFIDSFETIRELIKVDRNAYLKYQKIENLLLEIEKKLDCKCHKFDAILMQLYNLDCFIHGRTYILHDKNREFFSEIKNLYGHFPIDLIHSLQAIFYSSPYKEYMTYEAISILFTNWPDLLDRLEDSTPTMNACLLFNSGLDYMNMLSERITYYSRGRFVCTPLQVTSLENLAKETADYDCIITNIPEIYVNAIPIIVIPLIPDAKSFDKLMLIYENRFGKH